MTKNSGTVKLDFNRLIDFIIENSDYSGQRLIVEKEILHYDIINALDAHGLLNDLVFQGGTSLRLCRGSNRLSEDLDFAGGVDFCSAKLEKIKDCLEKSLTDRYGLHVYVKQPAELMLEPDYANIKVSKWQISIETSPGSKSVPRQKIKIEIANVPARTSEVLTIRENYPIIGGGRMPVALRVETMDEILADKIIAFPMSTKKIRHRDIWDIAWLLQQGAKLNHELVINKISDYKVTDVYPSLLNKAIANIPEVANSEEFKAQMTRFIQPSVIDRTISKPGFTSYLAKENLSVFTEIQKRICDESNQEPPAEVEFKM